MRVVLLVTDLQPGGTPLRVVRWAGWLPRIGVEPVVGCLAPRGPLGDRLDEMGVAHFSCDARHGFDLGVLPRLAAALRRYDPDVLHAFLFHANLAARMVGRLDRRRAIVTSTATVEIERRWHRAVESLTARRSDAHVVNTPRVARHVIDELGFPASRVVVIPNGVDLAAIGATAAIDRAAVGLPANVPLIAWAGRMDPIKRLDLWVRVFDRVRRAQPVCGVLIGDGPMRGAVLRDLAALDLLAPPNASNAVGRVRLTGWTARPAAWFKAADVLLLTSDTEGSPNVALEAMAAGGCVIATSVGGLPDLIEPGRTGWLCPPGDLDSMAAAVGRMCGDAAARDAIGRSARVFVQLHQGAEVILSGLDRTYRTVVFFRAVK